jgi:hypothetical protein
MFKLPSEKLSQDLNSKGGVKMGIFYLKSCVLWAYSVFTLPTYKGPWGLGLKKAQVP